MKRVWHYLFGILIAVGFYMLSSFLGALVNVVTAMAAGYPSYEAYIAGENYGGMVLLLLFTLANHLFMAWLTAGRLTAYAKKRGCLAASYYLCAAVGVVLFAVLILPAVTGKAPGWLPYVSHAYAIFFFGNRMLLAKKKTPEAAEAFSAGSAETGDAVRYADVSRENPELPRARFCRVCGAELKDNSRFCHKCGERIR